MNNFVSATIIVLGVQGVLGTSEFRKLTCYEKQWFQGDSVVLTEYTPNFLEYNFNNRAKSCCFKGIWLLYDAFNYNQFSLNGPSYAGWGDNHCVNFGPSFFKIASSARYVGHPDHWKLSTLNFYENKNFGGAEQYFYANARSLTKDKFGTSMILTGCNAWTIYTEKNYKGFAVCVLPSDLEKCYPSFFPDSASIKGMGNSVSSLRRGCYSNVVISGRSLIDEEGRTFKGISPRMSNNS